MCNMKEKFPKLLKDINPLIGRSTDKSGHNKKKNLYISQSNYRQMDRQTDKAEARWQKEKKKTAYYKRMTI